MEPVVVGADYQPPSPLPEFSIALPKRTCCINSASLSVTRVTSETGIDSCAGHTSLLGNLSAQPPYFADCS